MDTPIADFVKSYINHDMTRLHMPGHKGVGFLGCEGKDITEITGADELFSPNGIIEKSEQNASRLFDTARTVYSTGGSTQSIHAMLYIAYASRKERQASAKILAGRNAHKAFVYAAAKLGCEVEWLYPNVFSHICSCIITGDTLASKLNTMDEKPFAVYVTSPDYLGDTTDIAALSEICKKHDIPLLVDNAHGAYRAFLPKSQHPIHLGADICCDSAHKTLPVLTGGGYLHIAKDDIYGFSNNAVRAMEIFGSTSPSYLILQSLDICNKYLHGEYRKALENCITAVGKIKSIMNSPGIPDISSEPIKITADFSSFEKINGGFSEFFRSRKIEYEFSDSEHIVFMFSPQNCERDYKRLADALCELDLRKKAIKSSDLPLPVPQRMMSIREAILSPCEEICVDFAVGRICGAPTVSCPPAVPIAVSGEKITEEHTVLFKKYGIEKITVVK